MAWFSTLLAFFVIAFLYQAFRKARKDKKLQPGPRGFPIFDSIHLLGKNPHRELHILAKAYGPIMHIHLGSVPKIVLSSPEAVELFVKTHDLIFASRPQHEGSKHFSYERKGLIFAPYGSYWRDMRKMCALEMLSNLRINSFNSMRKEELGLLIEFVKGASRGCVAVDLSAKISALGADMSCRMVFGKTYMDKEFDERGFKVLIQEAMHLMAAPNLGDYIPQISALDLQGLTKRMKANSKVFDAFFEKIINEHIQSKDEIRTKDFVDVMMSFVGSEETEYNIDREHVKAIILDMLVASMDTSATVVECALSELLKHPMAMRRVQKELEEKVGLNRKVEETDLESLEYLYMVIKETFRLHPVVPLLLPHQSIEDCTIDGYFVPKHSQIIINTWAIGRDPNVWTDPEKFLPERFEGSDIDLHGRNFQLLPFGSGRRACPGMKLGLLTVRLVLAHLVHCFDWELPDDMLPSDLDMTEKFSLVTPREEHLLAVPSYRLHIE